MNIKFMRKADKLIPFIIKFGDMAIKIRGRVTSNGYIDADININIFDIENKQINQIIIPYGIDEFELEVDSGEYYMLIDNGYSIDLIDGIIV